VHSASSTQRRLRPRNKMSASTFSYAQAARGRTVSQPNQDETSSAAPSTTGSQGKDDASTGATSVTAPSVASTGAEIQDTEPATQAPVDGGLSKQDSEASSVVDSSSSTALATEQAGKTTQDGGAKSAEAQNQTQSQTEDKASRSTSRTSRSNDNADSRKGRKGKKGRSSDKDAQSDQNQEEDAEKVKEPPKPVILTEAAPPAVNPWAKRMEAQKAAVQAKLAPESTAAETEPKQAPSQEEAGVRSAMQNGIAEDKWAQKKPAEASRPADQAPRRSGPRGSRVGDKDEKSSGALPLAADPSSWPDPKSAAEREQPARKTQEKTDTTDKDSLDEAGPARKKTWEKLEIVHSVLFETQLPPLRASKPRGGASRGGREAGSMRGSHSAAAPATTQSNTASVSDKTPSPGGTAGAKTATARPREGSVPSRAAAQPQPAKRGSIDAASRDQRKSSVPGSSTEQARDASLDTSLVSLNPEADCKLCFRVSSSRDQLLTVCRRRRELARHETSGLRMAPWALRTERAEPALFPKSGPTSRSGAIIPRTVHTVSSILPATVVQNAGVVAPTGPAVATTARLHISRRARSLPTAITQLPTASNPVRTPTPTARLLLLASSRRPLATHQGAEETSGLALANLRDAITLVPPDFPRRLPR
jgi:la-related protein 1